MRHLTLIAVTAVTSAAIAAPVAVTAHERGLDLPSLLTPAHSSAGANSTRTPSGSDASGNDSAGRDSFGRGAPGASSDDGSTPGIGGSANSSGEAAERSSSGTSTRASAENTTGVVLVDTVLPGGEGAGTGMVLKDDGTVLTNYHVVSGSTQIRVSVPGGGRYSAHVVGHDASHDIAVLQLDGAKNLATVKLDADGVDTAEKVLAVGQGGGEGVLYAAHGVITGTNREITASQENSLTSSERLTGLLQTDAPIVAGYSGGPLFDASGAVVGLDTAASSTNSLAANRGASPQGYAIPIAQASSIASDILAGKKTATNHIGAKAALGVAVSTQQSARSTEGSSEGVTVAGVESDSPMRGLGLGAGALITGIDSTGISDTSDLARALDAHHPGDRITLTWSDDAGTHRDAVTLQTASSN